MLHTANFLRSDNTWDAKVIRSDVPFTERDVVNLKKLAARLDTILVMRMIARSPILYTFDECDEPPTSLYPVRVNPGSALPKHMRGYLL
jgi:hypothetical protein